MGRTQKDYSVIIPAKIIPYPTTREIFVAHILANYFQKNVKFVPRNNQKTPDFYIDGKYWELKTIMSNGRRTIQHALSRAVKQSPNIVVDIGLVKNSIKAELRKIRHHSINTTKGIKQLIVITKNNKVIELL